MSDRKLNILVLGNSGAGKSTLIEAISGVEKHGRAGEGDTQKIEISESETWPFVLIDTKGFEYNIFRQMETIFQVKQFTNQQIKEASKKNDGSQEKEQIGIDVVWYCVEGTSKRVFSDNIKMMNMAIKGWKNIPVFVVITKSYSEMEFEENKRAVEQAFAKNRSVNLQQIIPVVAKAYQITEEVTVEPRGIPELCEATLGCSEKAIVINEENRKRMEVEQKRFTANAFVTACTAAAATVGAVPLFFADSVVLVPLETGMAKGIFKIYNVDFSADLITGVIGSAAITNIAKAVLSKLKAIPDIAAQVAASALNAIVAGFFVAALGEGIIALAEAMYKGQIDISQVDDVTAFLSEKLKNSPVIGKAVQYLEENADTLKDKSPQEILKGIFAGDKEKKEK